MILHRHDPPSVHRGRVGQTSDLTWQPLLLGCTHEHALGDEIVGLDSCASDEGHGEMSGLLLIVVGQEL